MQLKHFKKSQSDQLKGRNKIEEKFDSIPEEKTSDYFPNLESTSSSLDNNLMDKEPIQEFLEKNNATNVYVYDKLISQKNCKVFDQVSLFHKLHDRITPLVMRRYRLKDENAVTRGFKTAPRRMRPGRKLCSYDEFF